MYLQTSAYKKIIKTGAQESEQDFCTQRYICIRPVSKRPENKIYYDASLKMHFESLETFNKYEIEVKDVKLQFDKQYHKAQDFLRRLNYKYDWVRVEQSSNGKITNIENIEELRTNWLLLKERVEKDYAGISVDQYLNGITDLFSEDDHFWRIFSQYNEYGLLFPDIPQSHDPNWNRVRTVYLDSNPKSRLCEVITSNGVEEKYRIYDVSLKQDVENSLITIVDCVGMIQYDTMCNQLHFAEVKVKYTYDEYIINEYHYYIKYKGTDEL